MTRRARKYAGTAASDITTVSIAFATPYAAGTEASLKAGAIRIG